MLKGKYIREWVKKDQECPWGGQEEHFWEEQGETPKKKIDEPVQRVNWENISSREQYSKALI